MSIIKANNLHKNYTVGDIEIIVLQSVSLAIETSEMVSVMGASGSGKTTLMNILGCMDNPTKGDYWLDGIKVSALSNDEKAHIRNKKIGFIFQNFNLLARASAMENVMMPLLYAAESISERKAASRAKELLDRVGLSNRLNHEPSQLSGGQKQRVAIARALINHPDIILADEPTGNLDTRNSEEILGLFRQFNQEDSITIVMVTHDYNVSNCANRVIYIQDGMIVDKIAGSESLGHKQN
jgi:ABC-type lipoprotein export system ATPase subunit